MVPARVWVCGSVPNNAPIATWVGVARRVTVGDGRTVAVRVGDGVKVGVTVEKGVAVIVLMRVTAAATDEIVVARSGVPVVVASGLCNTVVRLSTSAGGGNAPAVVPVMGSVTLVLTLLCVDVTSVVLLNVFLAVIVIIVAGIVSSGVGWAVAVLSAAQTSAAGSSVATVEALCPRPAWPSSNTAFSMTRICGPSQPMVKSCIVPRRSVMATMATMIATRGVRRDKERRPTTCVVSATRVAASSIRISIQP